MEILGIDIGGSGIKGAIVDTEKGEFVSKRYRIPTPKPATPKAIGAVVKEIADYFSYEGRIGIGFPALIKNGVIKTAANIDKSCIDVDANTLFSEISGREVKVWNDADVAGYAELRFGNNKDVETALFLTIGTGIGSAFIFKGQLIPSTEFGHLFTDQGIIAEKFTSDFVRKNEELNWDEWGKRFNSYLEHLTHIFSPDLFILGGGSSKKFHKFEEQLTVAVKVVPSTLLNKAGIIGAALLAE